MGFIEKINKILNYKINIDLNKRVSRNKALGIVVLLSISLVFAGFYFEEQSLLAGNRNYYENHIDNLKEALNKQPHFSSMKAEMAINYYLNGETYRAKAILKDILEKEPGNEAAELYLGLMLSEQKEYYESVKWLTKYMKKKKQGLEIRLACLYLGQDYLALKDYTKALTYLNEAAEREPGNPVVYFYLGQTYEKLNKSKSAISSYEQALKITNNYTEAEMALISLLKKKK